MSQPEMPEIWVTAATAITALGDSLEATAQAMLSGRTAGRWIELRTPACQALRVPAAPVENRLLEGLPFESSSERADALALAVARQATSEANLQPEHLATAALVFGSSKPSIGTWFMRAVMRRQPAVGSPRVPDPQPTDRPATGWDMLTPQRAAGLVATALATGGPILSSVAACSTGLHSLVRAVQWLRDGGSPIAIAGSVESSLNPLFAASFQQMRVLATTDPPAHACKPFDRNRNGFVIGEGAAALVLETADHARACGAQPLAVISGYAMGSDPTGLAELDQAGRPLASTIRRCLASAGVGPHDVACIKAHGTATFRNDEAEAAAIAAVFGEAPPPVISFKGHLGHTLGASGVIEAAIVTHALQTGTMPGCANLADPDPACGPNHPTAPFLISAGPAKHVLCLSAGFGGHLAAVLLRPHPRG